MPQKKPCAMCGKPVLKKNTHCKECVYKTPKMLEQKENSKYCTKCGIEKTIENTYMASSQRLYSYCKDCTKKDVNDKAKAFKQLCVDYKGGKCVDCGYTKCLAALQFHHLDPNEKDFNISAFRYISLNEEVKTELDKCVLLCANCHSERHYE